MLKNFQLQRAWPPDQGLCPWTPLVAMPRDPRYRLALRARHASPAYGTLAGFSAPDNNFCLRPCPRPYTRLTVGCRCVCTEAKDLCSRRECKFISISAILNHRVDDLLVGIVCQIRLHRSSLAVAAAEMSQAAAGQASRGWLHKLLHRRHKDSQRHCENLLVL